MKLFGTAGIRKKYPDVLDPVLAYRIGLVLRETIDAREAYIVHDTRTTSHLFVAAISAGLMASGFDANIIGLAPTPVAAYAAKKHCALGISVTASHNPPEYNGFKFYDNEGYEYVRSLEKIIEENLEKAKPLPWDKVGKARYTSRIIDDYINDMVEKLGIPKPAWKPRIVVDLANGAAYNVTPPIIRMLGAVPITINANPDGYFPVRPPEPRKDVLESYLKLYSSVEPAMILAHDGDADRLAVLDPHTGFIRQDRIIALYAKMVLREKKGRVIISIDTGRVVDKVVEELGGEVERYLLGKTHERVKELGASNVVIAAEPWKLIDPRWGPWVDGVWQVALLTKLVVERGKPLAKILDEEGIPDYPWDRRSYLFSPVEIRDTIYSELVEELKSMLGEPEEVITIDGYRYEYSDGSWILVRKSGTEPKIRLYMEAMTEQRLREMIRKTENKIKELCIKHDAKIVEKTIG
ncbi:MAG: phosphopentomutase/phosphoglucosamine mutase [Crenarchaeota archaeon]|nr:phosphopentomutase/phosphoglucosamine mutase [Thermoproteota archaeon]